MDGYAVTESLSILYFSNDFSLKILQKRDLHSIAADEN